jgi:hypothetical protein
MRRLCKLKIRNNTNYMLSIKTVTGESSYTTSGWFVPGQEMVVEGTGALMTNVSRFNIKKPIEYKEECVAINGTKFSSIKSPKLDEENPITPIGDFQLGYLFRAREGSIIDDHCYQIDAIIRDEEGSDSTIFSVAIWNSEAEGDERPKEERLGKLPHDNYSPYIELEWTEGTPYEPDENCIDIGRIER